MPSRRSCLVWWGLALISGDNGHSGRQAGVKHVLLLGAVIEGVVRGLCNNMRLAALSRTACVSSYGPDTRKQGCLADLRCFDGLVHVSVRRSSPWTTSAAYVRLQGSVLITWCKCPGWPGGPTCPACCMPIIDIIISLFLGRPPCFSISLHV